MSCHGSSPNFSTVLRRTAKTEISTSAAAHAGIQTAIPDTSKGMSATTTAALHQNSTGSSIPSSSPVS